MFYVIFCCKFTHIEGLLQRQNCWKTANIRYTYICKALFSDIKDKREKQVIYRIQINSPFIGVNNI